MPLEKSRRHGELIWPVVSNLSFTRSRLYKRAIAVTSQMYERERIASFWKEQREWFQAQLIILNRMARRLQNVRSNLDMTSFIVRFEDLIVACSEHYEIHA